jgi:hypothetical protein
MWVQRERRRRTRKIDSRRKEYIEREDLKAKVL